MKAVELKSYQAGLKYLLDLTKKGVQPGLSRVRLALRRLHHPERAFPSLVIGGTNGKGSVATLVARCLSKQGYRTGLFTSPHLHRLTERIRIDGREIGRERLVQSLRQVAQVIEAPGGPNLTFFEALTVVAARYFAEEQVDIAVLEVGLGGRLDATKVFPASVVGITSIGFDHQQFLGDTLESIAREKFALARRGALVVAGDLDSMLQKILEERVQITRSPLWRAQRDFTWQISSMNELCYRGPFGTIHGLPLPLIGEHQAHNTAVAITLLAALRRRGFEIEEKSLRRALNGLSWPARGEVCLNGRVIFDVAHNPAGAEALAKTLPQITGERKPVVIVFGCMRDKDVEGIARPLSAVSDHFFLAAPRMPRARPAEEFPKWIMGRPMPSVEEAVDAALQCAGLHGCVLVTGSTFVIAEARAHVLGLKNVDPSIPM